VLRKSSRAVDLNGETKRAKANHRSPITRSAYAIAEPAGVASAFWLPCLGSIKASVAVHSRLTRIEQRRSPWKQLIRQPASNHEGWNYLRRRFQVEVACATTTSSWDRAIH
jgi:hypothetical protein